MTTDTADLDAMLAALDDGDDSVLPLVADWLEEAGDQRAAGLRGMPRTGYLPERVVLPGRLAMHGWQLSYGHRHSIGVALAGKLDRVDGVLHYGDWRLFPSRSAAVLALAAALP
jgi:hypothetical protein